ncbi:hypothetical protein AB0425_17490 [Actinosynnema sp. NPDC051121]
MADAFDTALLDVTVDQFRATLLDAVKHVDVVQPAALREPVSLWLRGIDERACRENWTHLLGRPVVAAWNAARAILAAHQAPSHAVFREDGPLAGPGFAPC